RGVIKDRNNKLLVANTPVYDIMMIPKKCKISDTTDFLRVFQIDKEYFIKTTEAAKSYSLFKPSVFMSTLSDLDYARIQERLVDFPGFYVQARSVRNYPFSCMANALGYTGEVSKEKIELLGKDNYKAGDYVGISGIEEKYEKELRGKRGVKYVMVNVKGIEKGSFMDGRFDTLSVAGQDLQSTVDIDLQQYAELLMKNQTGSVVAIEPSTGEILCFVSAPSYDPNLLTGKDFSKNYRMLLTDPKKPLFNRPLMAMYPPGSTFKPINYLTALRRNVLDTNQVFPCDRSKVSCHGRHSSTNFHTGLQFSCNPYAYFVFRKILYQNKHKNPFIDTRINFEQWLRDTKELGIGVKLGIDLPNEKAGNLPSVKFYNKYFGENRWAFETIYSLGLGQGEVLVTPLQLANIAAIFANKGYYYTPHMIKAIGKNKTIRQEYAEKHIINAPPQVWNSFYSALADIVKGGTATMARSTVIEICGKTGTAENPHGKDHSLFWAFAPKDNPKIAIAVIMENAGWGATAAAPLASLVIERYLRGEIKRKYLEDYVLKGQFIE
ncbi:MAG: penicillin-binding transpeptidase domain-containing protein, partial [Cytophagales bacterium]